MPESPSPALSAAPTGGLPAAGDRVGVRDLQLGLGFLAAYTMLEWISFIEPYARLGITPWEPASGLMLAIALLTGWRHAWLLPLAPILSDFLVRGGSMPPATLLATSLTIGGIYAMAGLLLRWLMRRGEGSLTTSRNVVLLLAVAVAASFFVSLGEVGLLTLTQVRAPASFVVALIREWVGEFIGVALTTPFIVLLLRGRLTPSWTMVLPLLAIAGLLAVIFASPQTISPQLFYLLFIPIIWMALAYGLEGAAIAVLATQLGLMLSLELLEESPLTVLSFQLLMMVQAVTGLLTGAAVSDRERAAVRVRLLQDAQARFNRLGSMGALSAVLAHEIRQPLSAARTFARLALESLPEGTGAADGARTHLASVSAQIQRASDILHHMHDLIVVGRSELAPVAAEGLIGEAIELLRDDLSLAGVGLTKTVAPGLPPVLADAQQISQVIINLAGNAIEAIRSSGRKGGQIDIGVARAGTGWIACRIADNGPGFAGEQLAAPITPLASSKTDSLGLGLALCESIVQNHGGTLRFDNTVHGAMVEFTLREANTKDEG